MCQQTRRDIAIVGVTAKDAVLEVDQLLTEGGKSILSEPYQYFPGGMGLRVARVLGQFGLSPMFVSVVGNDFPRAKKYLEEAKVNTEYFVEKGEATTLSVILVRGQHRTVFMGLSAALRDQILDEPSKKAVAAVDWLYCDGSGNLGLQIELAKATRGTVVVDFERDQPKLRELSRFAHVVICSKEYVDARWPSAELEERLQQLEHDSPKAWLIGVSFGASGSVFLEKTEEHYRQINTPACKASVVDTTGAGDAFSAGLVYGLAVHWPAEKALRFASAAGAIAVADLGFPKQFDVGQCSGLAGF